MVAQLSGVIIGSAGRRCQRRRLLPNHCLNQACRPLSLYLCGVIGDKRATEPLIAILQDIGEDSDLREEAAHALGRMRATEAVDPLITAAGSDADYAVGCWSVTALGEIGDSRAVEPLVMLLEDKSNPTRIRGHAADALGRIGGNEVVEPLARILEDPGDEAFVRDRAAWAALAVADDRAARPLLMYFRTKLDSMAEPGAADADKMPEVLKGIAKLIDKLLG